MEKYINKADVVAEINRVLNSYDPNEITSGRYALADLRNFLDTLEVKEVDNNTDAFIEKAADYIANNMQCNGYTLQTKAKFIRDFKNYMKGE